MFCVRCGTVNTDISGSCSSCGQALFSTPALHPEQVDRPVLRNLPSTNTQNNLDNTGRGLSTKQMIVLWYGALAMIAVLLYSATTLGFCGALVIATWTLIFTLSRQPRANKKKLFFGVALPILLAVAIIAGFLYHSNAPPQRSQIPASSVELFDLRLGLNSSCGDITGRVRNRSEKTIKSIKLRVTLSNQTGPIDGADTDIVVQVPIGETRSFSGVVCDLRDAPGWTWSYTTLEVRGD